MHVFVTGGTGQTGPAIVSELIGSGHHVTGLARSDASAARLRALGATPLRGGLDDTDVLSEGAAASDGVIHMAHDGDFSDIDDMIRREVAAITTIGEALVDSGRPFVSTSGTLVMASGRVSVEHDIADPNSAAALRIPGENTCLAFAERDVRAVVLRLAPTVHGPGDGGFIPRLIATARRTGVSAYVGDGSNRWPAVHRLDAADLYRLALEMAPAGQALHATDEDGIPFKRIAAKIGEKLDVPTVSVSAEDAASHFESPFMAVVYGADSPASSQYTRNLLGWSPNHRTLLGDLELGDYFDEDA
jgi:nucleoside-diphosphate-sugar epimerase